MSQKPVIAPGLARSALRLQQGLAAAGDEHVSHAIRHQGWKLALAAYRTLKVTEKIRQKVARSRGP